METSSLISVIVPVYKVEACLDRCVESIVNQTYRNLEIILVDDGSPDNCPAMCDEWAKKDSRIKVIHKQNGGLSDARNAGMAIAGGEYMGFVDSDDWIAPEMYERLVNALEQDGSDIAACSVEMIWEDDTPSRMLTKSGNSVLRKEEAMRAIIEESWLKQPVWYKLYKTKMVRDILFPVGKYHEDVFWSYQAIGKAQKVGVIDYVGYYYWQRSGSIMGESYSLKRLDALEAMTLRREYIREYFPELQGIAKRGVIFSCFYHYQKALQYLKGGDLAIAQATIQEVVRGNKLNISEMRALTVKQRIWVGLSNCSLHFTCLLRNKMGIGL